ncbi:MAG: hypothetical protein HOG49_12835 [Candidatus Scalindua sp.]|jgi:hypothetical protein|nr:hypothetical protein [Candidatus Scalindua sp.]
MVDTMQSVDLLGAGNFKFSAIGLDELEASEYTLVGIVVDITGSVGGYETMLQKMIEEIVGACKMSARSENLLVRVTLFNSQTDILEIHGFKPVNDIDLSEYSGKLVPDAATNLFDATYDMIGSIEQYGKSLADQEYSVNAAVYVITDGDDNSSTMTATNVKDRIHSIKRAEESIESLISVLIGIGTDGNHGWGSRVSQLLKEFKDDADLTQYIDAGNANAKTLAKLGNFISQSISSQSHSLGTGGPSAQASMKF